MAAHAETLHRLQRVLWRWLKPRTRGVKVMIFNHAGEILLIRNTYGDRAAWVLPGGGLRPFETPETGARREVREELRCALRGLAPRGVYSATREGKRDTIWLFTAVAEESPTPDSREIAEAAFFPLAEPPPAASPATRRRIGEFLGQAAPAGAW
jgi:ADP-ribose pyrophosphatase YjhB (NUDIX family)